MVRVRVGGKVKEAQESESSTSSSSKTSSTSSEYETDAEPEKQQKEKKYRHKKTVQRKRKNSRCRSQDSEQQGSTKRQCCERRCRSHDGRLPEGEVRRPGNVKRRCSSLERPAGETTPAKKAKSQPAKKSGSKRQAGQPSHRSRSRTRASSSSQSHNQATCVDANCQHCQRQKPPADVERFPEVSVFNLQLIGSLTAVVDFILAKKKWLIVHLTDITQAVMAVPVDFWMNEHVINALQNAAFVIQISLDTLDGQSIIHNYRCLSQECILVLDPVTLEKRAFWQCFASIDDIYPELLMFIDSQSFFLEGGQNFYPGKTQTTWPRCTEAHLLPGPSKIFDKNKKLVDKSPSQSPSLSPLSDSATTPQDEPLNLSRKVSSSDISSSSSDEDADDEEEEEEESSEGDDSPSSQAANISSSTGNPPTPTDEPYEPYDDENYEGAPGNVIDPQMLVEQTRAALRGLENAENPTGEESAENVVPMDVGMGGDSVSLMDEINMQRAIIQSLGLQGDVSPPNIPPNSPVNELEPLVEISTAQGAVHQSPLLRGLQGALNPPAMAIGPVENPESPPVQEEQPADTADTADTGDGAFAGGVARPYTSAKQYLTICFVMPWGRRHYVRDLHSEHTMRDLILYLQSYLRRYKDINWQRDIINLKMANPRRNLSKLPLNMKLRDVKLGAMPIIFVFHFQYLDRLPS